VSASVIVLAACILLPRFSFLVLDPSFQHRIVLWKTALQLFSHYPFLGIGPGVFGLLHQAHIGQFMTEFPHLLTGALSVHNDALEIALAGGAVSFVLYGLLIGGFFLRAFFSAHASSSQIRAYWIALVSALCVNGLFHSSIMHPLTGIVFFFALGYTPVPGMSALRTQKSTRLLCVFLLPIAGMIIFAASRPLASSYLLAEAKGKPLDEALRIYDRAYAIDRTNYFALHHKGSVLHDAGKEEDALRAFEGSLAINPYYFSSLNNAANAHARLGNTEEAALLYERVIEINPNAYAGYFNYGYILLQQGKREHAHALFKKALALNPNSDLVKTLYDMTSASRNS
jgi:tetratricopeptide (TPR) repeat protein